MFDNIDDRRHSIRDLSPSALRRSSEALGLGFDSGSTDLTRRTIFGRWWTVRNFTKLAIANETAACYNRPSGSPSTRRHGGNAIYFFFFFATDDAADKLECLSIGVLSD
jgi:hypothetical protein